MSLSPTISRHALIIWVLSGVWIALALAYFGMSAAFVLHTGYVHHAHNLRYDFGYYDYAFQVVWGHQPLAHLYDIKRQIAWMRSLGYTPSPYDQYVYPPQFAVLFSWLGALSFYAASTIWAILSITAYLCAAWFTVLFAWGKSSFCTRLFWFGLALFSMPFLNDIFVCNVNSIIFLCITLTLVFVYRYKYYRWAGIVLGLGIMIKVVPIYLLAYLAFQRKWQTVASTIITGLCLSALTVCVTGPKILLWYILHFSHLSATSMKNGPVPYNSSILGAAARFTRHDGLPTLPHTVYLIYLIVLAAVVVITVKTRCQNGQHHAAMATLCCIAFSPLIETTHMVILLLPACLALAAMPPRMPKWTKVICFALCAIACIIFTPLGNFLMPTPYRYFIGLQTMIVIVIFSLWTSRTRDLVVDPLPLASAKAWQ